MFISKKQTPTPKVEISVNREFAKDIKLDEEGYDSDEKETNRILNKYFEDNNDLKTKKRGIGAESLTNDQIKRQTGEEVQEKSLEAKELKYKILERHSTKKRKKRGKSNVVDYGSEEDEVEKVTNAAPKESVEAKSEIFSKEKKSKTRKGLEKLAKLRDELAVTTAKATTPKSDEDEEDEEAEQQKKKKQRVWRKPW